MLRVEFMQTRLGNRIRINNAMLMQAFANRQEVYLTDSQSLGIEGVITGICWNEPDTEGEDVFSVQICTNLSTNAKELVKAFSVG